MQKYMYSDWISNKFSIQRDPFSCSFCIIGLLLFRSFMEHFCFLLFPCFRWIRWYWFSCLSKAIYICTLLFESGVDEKMRLKSISRRFLTFYLFSNYSRWGAFIKKQVNLHCDLKSLLLCMHEHFNYGSYPVTLETYEREWHGYYIHFDC